MAYRDALHIRLKSSRAPYTRAGIRFASNRETLVLTGAEVSDEQLARLSKDAAISIEIVDPATGARLDLVKPAEGGDAPAGDALVVTPAASSPAAAGESGQAGAAGAEPNPAPAKPAAAAKRGRTKAQKAPAA